MVERKIPDWARRDRLRDIAWLIENQHVLWPVAQKQFEEVGKGAIIVDTTQQPEAGKGNPFGYLPQEELLGMEDKDIERLLREYDPEHEMVIVLIKPEERVSSYRIQIQTPKNTS